MNEYTNIILLGIAIIIHELGHYAMFRVFKYKPSIKLKWWGINIGSNVWYKVKPIQAYLISLAGIVAGSVFVIHNYELTLFYLLMSAVDITNIISICSIPRKYKNLSLYEIDKLQILQIEKEIEK